MRDLVGELLVAKAAKHSLVFLRFAFDVQQDPLQTQKSKARTAGIKQSTHLRYNCYWSNNDDNPPHTDRIWKDILHKKKYPFLQSSMDIACTRYEDCYQSGKTKGI